MTTLSRTFIAATCLTLTATPALADNNGNGKRAEKLAGIYTIKARIDTIQGPSGTEYTCEFFRDNILPSLSCEDGPGIIKLTSDGEAMSLNNLASVPSAVGTWTMQRPRSERQIELRTIAMVYDDAGNGFQYSVVTWDTEFARGFDTFTTSYEVRRYNIDQDVNDPNETPASIIKGRGTGERWK